MNSRTAAFIRSRKELEQSRKNLKNLAEKKIIPMEDLPGFFRLREMLLLSKHLHEGIYSYIEVGGKSRGSYLIVDSMKNIEDCLKGVEIDTLHRDKIINTVYDSKEDSMLSSQRQTRPIPVSDTWFEKVWREYREGTVYS